MWKPVCAALVIGTVFLSVSVPTWAESIDQADLAAMLDDPPVDAGAWVEYWAETGEVVVQYKHVTAWLLRAVDTNANLMNGPDEPSGATGPLPLHGGFVSDNDDMVGEGTTTPVSHEPILLGRIIAAGLPITQANVDDYLRLDWAWQLGEDDRPGVITVHPVPEPSTLVLLAGGVAILLVRRRRKR